MEAECQLTVEVRDLGWLRVALEELEGATDYYDTDGLAAAACRRLMAEVKRVERTARYPYANADQH